jgi:hypothetical protein
MNCLRSLGSWDSWFESHTMHGCLVCVCVYSVCVVLCLGRGHATSWSLVQGVLPSVKWLWNWKVEARAHGAAEPVKQKFLESYNLHKFRAGQWFLKALVLFSKETRIWEKGKWFYCPTGRLKKPVTSIKSFYSNKTYRNKNLCKEYKYQ